MKWTRATIVIGAVLLAACQARQATVPVRPAAGASDARDARDARARDAMRMRQWGQETLEIIEARFRMPGRDLLVEQANTRGRQGDGEMGRERDGERARERDEEKSWRPGQRPAYMWSCGVQLFALTAAARQDPRYVPEMQRFARSLEQYWPAGRGMRGAGGMRGYDVLPGMKAPDAFYDDNEWVGLGMIEAYGITREQWYLERAKEIFGFVSGGEDAQLGGGIFWKENEKTSKNTCSNAPAAVLALRLYQVTGEKQYRSAGERWYGWTKQHLQDVDGLYFDHLRLDGSIEKTKWGYNSAMMIQAACLLHEITREHAYRAEALRVALAAKQRWVRPADGVITEEGQFAYLLCDALLMVGKMEGQREWRDVVVRGLENLHEHGQAEDGMYGKRWDMRDARAGRARLIDQACVARAYWMAEGRGDAGTR